MYSNKKTLVDIDFLNKKVIIRCDFNVPIKDGKIINDKRIASTLLTLKYLLDHNCSIIVLSHLSRIKTTDDKISNKKSLAPIAKRLQEMLPNNKVMFLNKNYGDEVKQTTAALKPREIILLENTRYNDVDDQGNVVKHESKNNQELAKFWAGLADVFVNDAFGTAHRAHASNAGIASNIKESCIGFLVEKEIKNIAKAIDSPSQPYVAILGGAKVSDKLKVIDNLLPKTSSIIITGGMAYTFLKAQGHDIGSSICETEMIPTALEILAKGGNKIVLTRDSLCTKIYEDVPGKLCKYNDSYDGLMGLDVGPDSIKLFEQTLNDAKTVVWNGPCGVSEFKNYANGTYQVAKKIKEITKNGCFSLIGGGDSAAAVINMGFGEDDFSFISTGGGASLTMIEGNPLVGIDPIQDK